MLWLATLAALAAEAPATEAPAAPERQSQAVVTIVRPARVKLGEGAAGSDQDPLVRETSISDGQGARKAAVLVEFS